MLDEDRARLLQMLAEGQYSQEELALAFGVSRWEVRKLKMTTRLREVAAPALSPEDAALLQVARATGLSAVQLQQALAQPPLTDRNIFRWLSQLPHERLARLFFQVTLTQQKRLHDARTEGDQARTPGTHEPVPHP